MLGDAIRAASDAFSDREEGGKAIVILSDGEDMESFPVEAAEQAWNEQGIRVYTVGIGDADDGARIPIIRNNQASWLTYQGQEVWSRTNPALLAQVAEAGGGRYVPAGTLLVDLGKFFDEWITEIDIRDRADSVALQTTPRFQWFAGLALILLLLECMISERRGQETSIASQEVPA